jgi:hypothetical protein
MAGARIGDCDRKIPPSRHPNVLNATLPVRQQSVTQITAQVIHSRSRLLEEIDRVLTVKKKNADCSFVCRSDDLKSTVDGGSVNRVGNSFFRRSPHCTC